MSLWYVAVWVVFSFVAALVVGRVIRKGGK